MNSEYNVIKKFSKFIILIQHYFNLLYLYKNELIREKAFNKRFIFS
jgi:hypothetical protein